MGTIRTKIRLANPRLDVSDEIEIAALVDSGAELLCLPVGIVSQLGLEANTSRMAATADGGYQRCRYVGPVQVRFEDRECYVGALELGDEVLLGAMPMEDMDLVINPRLRQITANPEHPDGPQNTIKSIQIDPIT